MAAMLGRLVLRRVQGPFVAGAVSRRGGPAYIERTDPKDPAMNTELFHRPLSPDEHTALFDAARQRALQARREAIDEFWSAVGRAAAAGWHALRHAGPRSRPARLAKT
jgi:hypothetical protein